jgi:Na+-driven multidrug efflux pump
MGHLGTDAAAANSVAAVVRDMVCCITDGMAVGGGILIGRAVNTVVINGIFTAGGDTLYDMYSLAICMWCLAIPLAAAGTFMLNWSPVVVYACTCLDEVGKIPWTIIHYRKYKWVKNLTR